MNNKMFYSVNIFMQSESDDNSPSLWEEKLLLISALSEEEATEKAKKYCGENFSYLTNNGSEITWSLYKIDRAYLIDKLEDGSELFSRFVKKEEALSLLTPFDD